MNLDRPIVRQFWYLCRVFWRGLRDTWSMFGWWTLMWPPVCFLVGWGLHIAVVKQFPGTKETLGEPMAEWWINIVYVLVPLGALALVAAFVNVILAPSRIDKEQRDRIRELERNDESPLVLEWNESRDLRWRDRKETLEVAIWAVNTSARQTISDVTMTVRLEVLRADQMASARQHADQLRDVPLVLTTDYPQSAPQKIHQLHPNDRLEFWIIKAQRGEGAFHIRHANREEQITQGGQCFWSEVVSGGLDAGTYQIIVTLKGKDMESQSLSFITTNKGRKLVFCEA